jgi:hypothetical protein
MTDQLHGLRPVAHHHWTAGDVMERVWRFGPLGHAPYARFVKLLPDGVIAGELGDNEKRWRVEGGQLLFLDSCDRCSTRFNRVFLDEEGRFALAGEFLLPRNLAVHVLQETEPAVGQAPSGEGLEFICNLQRPRRRNLVVVRADERSLHPKWRRDVAQEDRSWDLCVSSYADKENFGRDDFAEYQVHQKDSTKLHALHRLMFRGGPLWDYEFFLFPDDDLMTSWRDLTSSSPSAATSGWTSPSLP